MNNRTSPPIDEASTPSTIVEAIPAVRLESGELLTTAAEHAAHAARAAAEPSAPAAAGVTSDAVTVEDTPDV